MPQGVERPPPPPCPLFRIFSLLKAEHYPPPLYALEWMTTLFGLAAQPLISLVALDLILAGARNPVLRLCVALLGGMEEDLLKLDQEGLLEEFRSKAVAVDAEEVRIGSGDSDARRVKGWIAKEAPLFCGRSRCPPSGWLFYWVDFLSMR